MDGWNPCTLFSLSLFPSMFLFALRAFFALSLSLLLLLPTLIHTKDTLPEERTPVLASLLCISDDLSTVYMKSTSNRLCMLLLLPPLPVLVVVVFWSETSPLADGSAPLEHTEEHDRMLLLLPPPMPLPPLL